MLIRHLAAVWVAAGVCSISSLGFAADRGLALGLRTGYAVPFGKEGTASSTSQLFGDSDSGSLSDDLKGALPIWVDVGYRLDPALYLGAFFQYGFGFIDKKSICLDGFDCSASDVAFGANVHYHLSPAATFDPWIGAGLGYEFLNFNFKGQIPPSGATIDGSLTLRGPFFSLQAGGDLKATPDFAIGPFLSFSVGRYSRYSADVVSTAVGQGSTTDESGDVENSTHEWLTIGVRGQYNL